jgi:ABC-type Fe2+-enterobactin transport system substrate-binding protein
MVPIATIAKQPPRARQRRAAEGPARPSSAAEWDAAATEIQRRMVLAGTDEMARYLQEHLGQKLTAYVAGLKDAKSVGQWAAGKSEPPAITRERLRAAFHATSLFLLAYSDQAAQGWFFGANSALDDRAPAAVLRAAETPDEMALIAPLARAFVRGAH